MNESKSLDQIFHLDRGRFPQMVSRVCQLVLRFLFHSIFRLKFRGLENLPRGGAFLLCPNHQSFIDPFFLYAFLPSAFLERTLFIADGSYFSRPSLSWMNRFGRVLLTGRQSDCVRLAKEALQRGMVVCIFPEGGRTKNGDVMKPRRGAGILSRETGVPIVPVSIHGADRVLSVRHPGFHFCRISIVIGSAISAHQTLDETQLLQQWQTAVIDLSNVRTAPINSGWHLAAPEVES